MQKMIEYVWFLTPTSPFIEANSVPYLLTIWGSSPENWFRIEHLSFIQGWIGHIVWFRRKKIPFALLFAFRWRDECDSWWHYCDYRLFEIKHEIRGMQKRAIIVERYVRMWRRCESIDIWSGKTHPLIMDAFSTPRTSINSMSAMQKKAALLRLCFFFNFTGI